MKIYFCDICNESIPLLDLKEGRATTIKGKIFCGQCNPLNEVSGSRSARLGFLTPVLLFVVAAALGGGALWQSAKARREVAALPRYDAPLSALDARVAEVLARVAEVDTRGQQTLQSLTAHGEEQAGLRENLSQHGHRLDRFEDSVEELRGLLEVLRSDREQLEQLGVAQDRLENLLEDVRQRLAQAEAQLEGGAVAGAVLAAADTGPEATETPELDDATRALLADLASRDPGVRWTAVDQLRRRHDRLFIPHLLPLLEDPDAFVQFHVINTLRELNARPAVQPLIRLLRDGDAIVREEALEALVALTGHPSRFDTSGSPADREKGVRAWEEWYQTNRDRFEGDAADDSS